MDSIVQILPVVFYMYTIFQLICYALIRDLKEKKDDDGTVYYDRAEMPSITFTD